MLRTPLNKQDTVEFREREKRAQLLANEIEQSDNYIKGMELEDDDDEENAFSAVSRTDANGITPGGKYVPPHLRRNPQHGRVRSSQSPGSPVSSASPQAGTSPKPTSMSPLSPVPRTEDAPIVVEADKGDLFSSYLKKRLA